MAQDNSGIVAIVAILVIVALGAAVFFVFNKHESGSTTVVQPTTVESPTKVIKEVVRPDSKHHH